MPALPINDDDRALIKPYVILPMILRAFERDTRVFQSLRTPDPYVGWINAAKERLSAELRANRFEAVKRGVRVYDEQRTPAGMTVRYMCRGYHGEMTLSNEEISVEAAELMRKYLTFENEEKGAAPADGLR